MAKYIAKKTKIIEAEQFLPPYQIPKGVINVYGSPDGKTYSGQVWTIQGERVNVKAGEWIVQEEGNPDRYYPIADDVFRKLYYIIPYKDKDEVLEQLFDKKNEEIDLKRIKFNKGLKDILSMFFLRKF